MMISFQKARQLGFDRCIEEIGENRLKQENDRWLFIVGGIESSPEIACILGRCPDGSDVMHNFITLEEFTAYVCCNVARDTGEVTIEKKDKQTEGGKNNEEKHD